MRARYGVPLGVVATGAAGLAYAAGFEARSFRLRRVEVPVLPEGMRPIRILQVS
ncbi:MAG: metallophosphoesterase, partial [Actinomycetia bacterium]|nr:metallophosphoesterase [Actinomycetes bacterium]